MWGCIDHILCIRYADGAPSLYVRVYQNWRNVMNNCRTLPHYMWGCIALITDLDDIYNAPSLYVKVYRPPKKHTPHIRSSLIICEGVSQRKSKTGWTFQLPHYMWGCIPCMKSAGGMALVPSLYVRVYRLCGSAFSLNSSSLIICEGVSHRRQPIKRRAPFPHYMWGCIFKALTKSPFLTVPSLYVRVYRKRFRRNKIKNCSLTIREGVSVEPLTLDVFTTFPHYTWGCII